MKRLISLILASAAFVCIFTSKADNLMVTVTSGSASNLLSSPAIVDEITITATTTNATTVKFYDSSSTTTTKVQAAYTSFSTYSTNFDSVFTNEAGLLVTNTFKGVVTWPTSVSAVTNSIPAVASFVIPASSQRTKSVKIQTIRGLTIVPNQDIIVEVDYRKNP